MLKGVLVKLILQENQLTATSSLDIMVNLFQNRPVTFGQPSFNTLFHHKICTACRTIGHTRWSCVNSSSCLKCGDPSHSTGHHNAWYDRQETDNQDNNDGYTTVGKKSGNPNPILLLLPLLILPLLQLPLLILPLLQLPLLKPLLLLLLPLRQLLKLTPQRLSPLRLTLRLTLRLRPFRQILKLTPPRLSPPKQTLSLLSKLWTKITHKRFLK